MNTVVKIPGQSPNVEVLHEITVKTDTRSTLAHSKRRMAQLGFADVPVFDVDTHHQEIGSWKEIAHFIDDPVFRSAAIEFGSNRPFAAFGSNAAMGMTYQDVGGRIPHQSWLKEDVEPGPHRDVALARRSMEALGVDYMIVFPTSMLLIGMHPQPDVEVQLANAYNRWLTEVILPQDQRLKALICLPFNTPHEALKTAQRFANCPGVVGFCIPSVRHAPVQDNTYMPVYRFIEETGKPLAFHAGYHWDDPSLTTLRQFLGVHALGFVWCNLVIMTNWILNGLPERFPKLRTLWVESGLAWIPFLMQRLDDQYLMRQSEAPLLKRMPSDYMRECFYTCQPMERSNMKALQLTMEMISAETQLVYASDWPHFDFDTPSVIADLPFLNDQAKRNILGGNAARLFGLELRKARN